MSEEAHKNLSHARAVLHDFEEQNKPLLELYELLKAQATESYWGLHSCTTCKRLTSCHKVEFFDAGNLIPKVRWYCCDGCLLSEHYTPEFDTVKGAYWEKEIFSIPLRDAHKYGREGIELNPKTLGYQIVFGDLPK